MNNKCAEFRDDVNRLLDHGNEKEIRELRTHAWRRVLVGYAGMIIGAAMVYVGLRDRALLPLALGGTLIILPAEYTARWSYALWLILRR